MSDWDRELDDFRARIRALERSHACGEWDAVVPWVAPEGDLGPPTAEHFERLQDLLIRAATVGVQVARAMRERGEEHAESRSRVAAARRYLQSEALL